MQDIHSIGGGGGGDGGGGGGGGRLFGCGGGGDRRLRPHHHHHHHHHQGHGPQALKCPRCESLNTKFCYYNNYNLSQPRHFCKSCRRYWTKGGVLRNVPVGGGCRKTKRSKPKSSTSNNNNSSSNRSSETTALRKSSTNSQNSSSDSSSLTATTTAANTTATATTTTVTTAAAPPATAAEVLSGINSTTMLNFQESSTGFLNPNPSFDQTLLDHSSAENNNIFPEIGTFTSLIASSTGQLPLGFNGSPFRLHHIVENTNASQQQHQWIGDELKVPETSSLSFMELQNKSTDCGGGLGTEDWNNAATDQALFDLTGTVDQSYWNQTQWEDHDHDHDHANNQLNYLP